LIRLNIIGKRVFVKNFTIKEINDEYISWFSGKNEDLKYSRHYKKKYSRTSLIKNHINFISSGNIFLGIFDKKLKILIGTMTIYLNKKKSGNLGIFIGNKKYASKGYAFESCLLVIKYLLKKKVVNSIEAGAKKENLKMINLMKNLNMKKVSKQNSKITTYVISKLK